MRRNHGSSSFMPRIVGSQGNEKYASSNGGIQNFDIRLKENFKLFVSGPLRCGKTVFVSKLIENIQLFAKHPPGSKGSEEQVLETYL